MNIVHSFRLFRCMFGQTVEITTDSRQINYLLVQLDRALTRKWS